MVSVPELVGTLEDGLPIDSSPRYLFSQHFGIGGRQAQGRAEYGSLLLADRMHGGQAVLAELAKIDFSSIGIREPHINGS